MAENILQKCFDKINSWLSSVKMCVVMQTHSQMTLFCFLFWLICFSFCMHQNCESMFKKLQKTHHFCVNSKKNTICNRDVEITKFKLVYNIQKQFSIYLQKLLKLKHKAYDGKAGLRKNWSVTIIIMFDICKRHEKQVMRASYLLN